MSVFARIAKRKPYKSSRDRALQKVAQRLLAPGEPTKRRTKPGHVTSEAEWLHLVQRAPGDQALDLALTPDHPNWGALALFVLPLAYLTVKERERVGEKADIAELVRMGPYPDRRGKVLYERTQSQPEFDAVVDARRRDSATDYPLVR